LIERFLEWADGPAGIIRPKEIKIVRSPDPNAGLMCILDLSAIRSEYDGDDELEPKAKRVTQSIVSSLKVPHKALLNALFHEDDPLVQEMRVKLLKFNPNFFSLDDMPPEPMGPPKSKNELENDSVARLKVHPNVVLTLWYTLRQLRDENSFWRPYLDLLPKRIPTPLFWSEDELEIIKGTNLYEGVLQLRSLLRKVWNTLKSVEEASISLEEVQYCWTLFSSRAFTVSTDASKDQVHTHTLDYAQTDSDAPALVEPCLVPFADLFNHSNSARVQYVTDHRAHTFNLNLETVAQNGQEVFNNYGSKSNEFFIIGYGFAVLDLEDSLEPPNPATISYQPRRQTNQHNNNWVQINIDERDPNRASKMSAIKSRHLGFRHHIKSDGAIPQELLEAIRICLLDAIDLYFLDTPTFPTSLNNKEEVANTENDSDERPKPVPISFEREILLYDTLTSLLQSRLEKMDPADAVEDREAFLAAVRAKPGLTWAQTIGWQYRVEQKEILESALDEVSVLKANFISSARSKPVLESNMVPSLQDDMIQLSESWQARIGSWMMLEGQEGVTKMDGKIPVLRVPVEWVICNSTIRTSTLGAMLSKAGVWEELEEELLIAIFILFQLHTPGQPFNEYFQAVAKAYKGRPKYMNALAFVDAAELLLQGTPAEAEVSGQLEEYEQLFRRTFCKLVRPLHANFQDPNMFAWKHFSWAFSIIACEGQLIPIPIDGDTEEMQLGLIPTFGIRRWHPQELCELDYDDQGAILISSSKSYAINDSTNAKHGFYSGCLLPRNEELIRSYGFFIKNQNMNIIPFPIFATEDDPLLDQKMGILSSLKLETDHHLDGVHLPSRILNTLKILSMNAEELKSLQESIETNPELVKIVVSSQSYLQSFKERLKAMVDALQTSIAEHEASQTTELDAWIKKRLSVVIEYKRSLLDDLAHHQAYAEEVGKH
jgi:hypothetical protein